jgi:hypothetical protein
MDKPSQIESSIGIFIIIVILTAVGFYGYSSYQRVVKVQEETINSLQKQLSEVQTHSIK